MYKCKHKLVQELETQTDMVFHLHSSLIPSAEGGRVLITADVARGKIVWDQRNRKLKGPHICSESFDETSLGPCCQHESILIVHAIVLMHVPGIFYCFYYNQPTNQPTHIYIYHRSISPLVVELDRLVEGQ